MVGGRAEALPDLAGREQPLVDAWYLDGFAPSRNETMWTAGLLQAAAGLSRPGASLRDLYRRRPGAPPPGRRGVPGRKGARLRSQAGMPARRARRPRSAHPASRHLSSWDLPRQTCRTAPNSVLVVGGGLAGCTAAAALARRGIAVTLLEQGALASAGSGNDQGILYTRLSRQHSALVDFALQSFQFASTFYRQLFQAGTLAAPLDGELCGSFQQSDDAQ